MHIFVFVCHLEFGNWGEGVGVKWKKKWPEGRECPIPHLAYAPILYQSIIQDGDIENPIYYLAFCSKITPAQLSKLTFSKRRLLATFNCKTVTRKKIQSPKKK